MWIDNLAQSRKFSVHKFSQRRYKMTNICIYHHISISSTVGLVSITDVMSVPQTGSQPEHLFKIYNDASLRPSLDQKTRLGCSQNSITLLHYRRFATQIMLNDNLPLLLDKPVSRNCTSPSKTIRTCIWNVTQLREHHEIEFHLTCHSPT